MSYVDLFVEQIEAIVSKCKRPFPYNDISITKLFCECVWDHFYYVPEVKQWYTLEDSRWAVDKGALKLLEYCKDFVLALCKHSKSLADDDENKKELMKLSQSYLKLGRRKQLLDDARSVAVKSIAEFDSNPALLNCNSCTFDLEAIDSSVDGGDCYTTRLTFAEYNEAAVCERWEHFVDQIMCGDKEMIRFLQKSFGYALNGKIDLECLFILYGSTSRNGKSTLMETIAYVLGDYAMTMQPESLARRPRSSGAASPDLVRLAGARLVHVPEPKEGLKLDAALIKQLTGGDTLAGRFLYKDIIEIKPHCKLYINTNYLPRMTDRTIFESGRVIVIPFEKHFTENERDKELKKFFKKPENMPGILNWLLKGYKMFQAEGLTLPKKVQDATLEYGQHADNVFTFINEHLVSSENEKASIKTSVLYDYYKSWAESNNYQLMDNRAFVGRLRYHANIKRKTNGNVVVGFELKKVS